MVADGEALGAGWPFRQAGPILFAVMTAKNVPRIGRALDLVGLLLFLGGGGVWLRAWVGFQQVRHYQPRPGDPLWSATHRADGFLRLQHVGMKVMAAGIAVFVIAWWVARTRMTTAVEPE